MNLLNLIKTLPGQIGVFQVTWDIQIGYGAIFFKYLTIEPTSKLLRLIVKRFLSKKAASFDVPNDLGNFFIY